MKKFFTILFNIIWIILFGIASAISCVAGGIMLCITLIGIPAGIVTFKFIPLVFSPFGKTVILNFDKHPVLNVLWFIFIGLGSLISYVLLGALLCATLIGIPLGLQMFKLAKYVIAPFGAKIVKTEELKTTDTLAEQVNDNGYTLKAFNLLPKKIKSNPNLLVDGKRAKEYIKDKQPTIQLEKSLNSLSGKYRFSLGLGIVVSLLLLIACVFFGLFYGYLLLEANLDKLDLTYLQSLNIDLNYYIELINSYAFIDTLRNLDLFYSQYFIFIIIGVAVLAIVLLIISIAYNTKHLAKTKKSRLALYNSTYGDLVAVYLNHPMQKTKKKKTLTQSLLYASK